LKLKNIFVCIEGKNLKSFMFISKASSLAIDLVEQPQALEFDANIFEDVHIILD
jgi:hypothetical protein